MSDISSEYGLSTVQRIASAIFEAKRHEGEGHILHDSYTKSTYIYRRRGHLSTHPNINPYSNIHANVTLEADQVFNGQADELSAQQVRMREHFCEIDPLTPFPTSTNTTTIDNFAGYGTREWTAETGHPVFVRSLSQSSSNIDELDRFLEESPEQTRNPTFGLDRSVPNARIEQSSASQSAGQSRQTTSAGQDPEYPGQQTLANMSAQHQFTDTMDQNHQDHEWSAMDPPQAALNPPRDDATMQKIWADLGHRNDLTPADCPLQYQNPPVANPPVAHPQVAHQQVTRPMDEVSAVQGRAMSTPVKYAPGAKKRPAPVELDEADANITEDDQAAATPTNPSKKPIQPPKKKVRVTVTAGADEEAPEQAPRRTLAAKAPRHAPPTATAAPQPVKQPPPAASQTALEPAEELEQAPPPVKTKATSKRKARPTRKDPSEASTVPEARPKRKAQHRTLGGKAPPAPPGSAIPAAASRTPAAPAAATAGRGIIQSIADGNRLPKSKAEASAGAARRREDLLSKLQEEKKRNVRHPDLGPEFFDIKNFTADEKDPNGEPPVRCVCEENDGNYQGDWIGCDKEECRVWQHVGCMGSAVPAANAREDAKYACQQCDPFAHKNFIKQLRKDHPIN